MPDNQKIKIPLHDLGKRYIGNRRSMLDALEQHDPLIEIFQFKDIVGKDRNYQDVLSYDRFPFIILNQYVESYTPIIDDLCLMHMENMSIPNIVVIGSSEESIININKEHRLGIEILFTSTGHLSNCNMENLKRVSGNIAEHCFDYRKNILLR